MRVIIRLLGWSLLGLVSSCIEPYEPSVLSAPNQFLVVDGYINTAGVTTIRLSRSTNLTAAAAPTPEAHAQVYIEDEATFRRLLLEGSLPGTYSSISNQLTSGRNYRLHIKTSAGKEYVSDYSAAKTTPPIDNVTWKAGADGLNIYVDAHDATNSTHYYRWEYAETWHFTSAYKSVLQYVNKAIIPRPENIYDCWQSANSTIIQTSSTAGLTQDVVKDYHLAQLPANSIKLRIRYSILVRQYALSKEEAQYWQDLKKNTENLGTPFDPLPSQIQGNVHCLAKADEPVLGFVGVASATEKRLFISHAELPQDWRPLDTDYLACMGLDTVRLPNPDYTLDEYFSDVKYRMPVDYFISHGRARGYFAQTPECIDCRLHGTNVKPAFW